MKYLAIILAVAFVNNIVLTQFLGVSAFLNSANQTKCALKLGGLVTGVMVIAAAVTWPVERYVLDKFDVEYLRLIIFVLVIAAIVEAAEQILKKVHSSDNELYRGLFPLLTTNSAVLGIALLNISEDFSFLESIANAFGAGIGFIIVGVIFVGIKQRVDICEGMPKAFQGIPAYLLSAAILSLSFMCFNGVVESIF